MSYFCMFTYCKICKPFDAILPITDVAIAYSESGGCNAEDTSQHTFMDSSLTFVDGDGTAQTIVITDNNGAAHLILDSPPKLEMTISYFGVLD